MVDQAYESLESYIEPLMGKVRASILVDLSNAEMSMDELSRKMQINKNAVKEHMEFLETRGYVKSYFKKGSKGRPSKYFELTDRGMEMFPKRYTLLSSLLVEQIEEEFGEGKLNEILGKVADRIIGSTDNISEAGDSRDSKIRRLQEFVNALNQLGYYAKMEVEGNSVRIIRRNCIFFELAKNNRNIICGSLGSRIVSSAIHSDFSLVEKFSVGDKKCVVELTI
ncbi:MAG: transcriptional regulator [Candidatus Thermoplasmatota archaeon]|jgi:predicted ArsR family transcriptional regulator|nr:transcriptional regulator [Candidatus Thermoplasmatota archaeon]